MQACRENQNDLKPTTENNQIKNSQTEMVQLGQQLQNPYTVANMQAAYNIIKQRYGESILNITISATHKYMKFSPSDGEQYAKMMEDTTVEFFSYPLDYEIIGEGGVYYHDPSLPDSVPTFQYAAVDINYTPNPNITSQVLSNLCIPEITPYFTNSLNDTTLDFLIDEALILTGNYEADTNTTKSTLWTKYNPQGTIKVYDNVIVDFIPVENVKVRARRWFIVYTDRTDANGYYYMSKTFKRKCNYSLKWSTPRFYVTNGIWFQAIYNGPKKTGNWNLNIGANEKSIRFATIFRGANRYHYKDIGGLKRPGVLAPIKMAYIDDAGDQAGMNIGNYWQAYIAALPGIPNIFIWGKNPYDMSYYPTNVLFSTTVHELGHASHISLIGELTYLYEFVIKSDTRIIPESWANCVEWYITKIEYNELGISDYDDPDVSPYKYNGDNMQWYTSGYSEVYTPLFIDLFEDYNQSLIKGVSFPSNRCPKGGSFDGSNCHVISAPYLEEVFIYTSNDNYYLYYTPQGTCDCECNVPDTYFDGANCYVITVGYPGIPFVNNNNGYIYPAGDDDYPYDQIFGYEIYDFENDILKHSYGLSSLKDKLKENLPYGTTNRHIDVYMDYFFNF